LPRTSILQHAHRSTTEIGAWCFRLALSEHGKPQYLERCAMVTGYRQLRLLNHEGVEHDIGDKIFSF